MHKRIGDRDSWYPTSREKRARCGALQCRLHFKDRVRIRDRSSEICGKFRNEDSVSLPFHRIMGASYLALLSRDVGYRGSSSTFLETV